MLGSIIHHVAEPVWWVPPYLASLEPLVWIPCCAIGRSGGLSLSFKTVPKSKVRICISHIYILVVSLLPRVGEPLADSLELWFLVTP
jgi:hypothetical protein